MQGYYLNKSAPYWTAGRPLITAWAYSNLKVMRHWTRTNIK